MGLFKPILVGVAPTLDESETIRSHKHYWTALTNPPDTATRWPTWDEVTSKPTVFTPDTHTHLWADITDKPTTFTPSAHTHTKSEITDFGSYEAPLGNPPTDGYVLSSTAAGVRSWVAMAAGVTDHGALSGLSDDDHPQYHTDARGDARYSLLGHDHAGTYQPLDADLTAIGALAGTSGLLRKTAANTFTLDTATYLTGNQTITLTGDVSGSGTTSIAVTVADDSHNHIIGNVDGLQTALDGKAASSHTHSQYAENAQAESITGWWTFAGIHASELPTIDDASVRVGSGFFQASNPELGSGWPTGASNWWHLISSTHSNLSNYYALQIAAAFHSNSQFYIRSTAGNGAQAWNKLWHDGNDGAGSGLDADTLDSLQETVFLRYRGVLTESAQNDTTTDAARDPGFYRVSYPGASNALLDLGGIGGSTPRVQMRFTWQDEMYFRAARDSETQWDSISSMGNRVWHSGNVPGLNMFSVGSIVGPRFTTPHGYIEFGPANTSWAHIYTDRPGFYFNKDLKVNGTSVSLDGHTHSYLPLSGGTMSGNIDLGANALIGPTFSDANTIAVDGYGTWNFRRASSSAANLPEAANNANGILTLVSHVGPYGKQLGFTDNDNLWLRRITGGAYATWYKFWTSHNFDPNSKSDTNHTHAATDITSGTIATARLGSGTANSSTFLRGDGTWATPAASVASLGSIGDVSLTSIGTGEILYWSGSAWINRTVAEAGIAALTHLHSASSITSGTMATARLGSGTANSTKFLRGDSTWQDIPESGISDETSYQLNVSLSTTDTRDTFDFSLPAGWTLSTTVPIWLNILGNVGTIRSYCRVPLFSDQPTGSATSDGTHVIGSSDYSGGSMRVRRYSSTAYRVQVWSASYGINKVWLSRG